MNVLPLTGFYMVRFTVNKLIFHIVAFNCTATILVCTSPVHHRYCHGCTWPTFLDFVGILCRLLYMEVFSKNNEWSSFFGKRSSRMSACDRLPNGNAPNCNIFNLVLVCTETLIGWYVTVTVCATILLRSCTVARMCCHFFIVCTACRASYSIRIVCQLGSCAVLQTADPVCY